MKKRFWVTGAAAALIAVATWMALKADVSALEEPSWWEAEVAWRAKRFVVARRVQKSQLSPRPGGPNAAVLGEMQFRARCASCHGLDGRRPTEMGRAMYPRASDLGSAEVQQWSDEELFWIIQHGVRLTGMPGFGKALSAEEIWPRVDYIRTLR
jgi:mono/diheme cytochrome c family protein